MTQDFDKSGDKHSRMRLGLLVSGSKVNKHENERPRQIFQRCHLPSTGLTVACSSPAPQNPSRWIDVDKYEAIMSWHTQYRVSCELSVWLRHARPVQYGCAPEPKMLIVVVFLRSEDDRHNRTDSSISSLLCR